MLYCKIKHTLFIQSNFRIKISYTVKHTVDSEAPEELNPNAEQPEGGETKSKFEFKVDIIKDGITIGITCNFGQENPGELPVLITGDGEC
jgi:hypothetical protein